MFFGINLIRTYIDEWNEWIDKVALVKNQNQLQACNITNGSQNPKTQLYTRLFGYYKSFRVIKHYVFFTLLMIAKVN